MTDHPDDVRLSRLIDGDLSLTSREAVIAHLRLCPSCAQRHDELVAVTATLRREAPARWTAADTEAVLGRLPQRRHLVKVAVAGGVSLLMCALVLVEAAPLVGVAAPLVGVLVGVGGTLAPPAVAAGGVSVLIAIAAIAILAPLAAYPLARWR